MSPPACPCPYPHALLVVARCCRHARQPLLRVRLGRTVLLQGGLCLGQVGQPLEQAGPRLAAAASQQAYVCVCMCGSRGGA